MRAGFAFGAAVLLIAACDWSAFGQSCVTSQGPNGQATGPSIYLNFSGVPDQYLSALNSGAYQWNASGCNSGGTAFPTFLFASQSTGTSRLLNVAYDPGPGAGQCGNFNGITITLYGTATLANNPSTVVSCTPVMAENFAHELGHALGLGDSSCNGFIMNNVQIDAQGNYNNRSVQPGECQAAADKWVTPDEATPPPPPPDREPPNPGPNPNPRTADGCGDDCSPIIINFENGDYRLTGADAPVRFAMNPMQAASLMGWTAAGADEAFLWLDRNHNGRVTSGVELFGNFTRLSNGDGAKNGFQALAEFDSNHDSVIDYRDPIWSELQLWRDLNHNGISEPNEIAPLDEK